MLLTIAAIVATHRSSDFRFAGGSGGDLVRSIAKSQKSPVCLLVSPGTQYKAFSTVARSPESFRRTLNVRLNLAVGTKAGLGLAPKSWPSAFYFLDDRPAYAKAVAVKYAQVEETGGRYTVHASASPMRAEDLVNAKWSKSLRIHWFYRQAALWLEANAASEGELLRTVAEALGSTFQETKDAYVLRFSPASYRSRGVARLDEELDRSTNARASSVIAFTREALSQVDDPTLSKVFALEPREAARKPDIQVLIDSPLLKQLAQQRLVSVFGLVDGETSNPSLKQVWEHHQRYVDWELPPLVDLSQSGIYTAVLRGTDYDGKPFQVLL